MKDPPVAIVIAPPLLSALAIIFPEVVTFPLTFSDLAPFTVTVRSPPIVEFPNVKSLLLTTVALAVPDVLKLAVPAIVNTPEPAMAAPDVAVNEPVVVTSTPKSMPPVPALIVMLPRPDEAVPEKFTALPVAVAFKVSGPE